MSNIKARILGAVEDMLNNPRKVVWWDTGVKDRIEQHEVNHSITLSYDGVTYSRIVWTGHEWRVFETEMKLPLFGFEYQKLHAACRRQDWVLDLIQDRNAEDEDERIQ